jgi:hypothetical protein
MDAGNWLVRNFGSGSGGPPQVARQPAAPSISPAVPNTSYQGYIPGGFDYMRQDPMTKSSRGGYPRYAGGPSLESLPNVTSFDRMIDGPPVGPQDNINTEYGRPANQAVTFPSASPMGMTSDYGTAIPRDSSSSDYGALPARFNAPGYQPFRSGAKPSVYASAGDFSGSGGADTLVGGAGGLPGGADRLAEAFSPPASGVTFMNGAPQGVPGVWAAGPGVVPAGDPPAGSPDLMAGYDPQTGRFTDPADTGGLSQPARVAARGAIGPVSYVKPQSVAQRAGGVALGVGANALLGPLGGILARVLYNSATRGSFDKTSQYTGGPVTSYDRAAPNPYGGYTTGSSYSASPFTPAGYTAPNFNPTSGGALYSYQPNGQGGGSYVDSQGRVHQY